MIIDDKLLDTLREQAKASERKRVAFDLRNDAGENSQRMLNIMEPGTAVPIHRHADTIETAILIRGRMDEIFFDADGKEIERIHLDRSAGNYGLQIPVGMWHTVEVLEPSVLLEIKAGKYQPIRPCDVLEPSHQPSQDH
jgi:cupin fold WbuC family metalloprotein